jgi:hypothetical protein
MMAIPPTIGPSTPSEITLVMGPHGSATTFVQPSQVVPFNVSYCGLLGNQPGAAADLPNYSSNVSIVWFKLCKEPSFVAAINEWGGLVRASSAPGNNSSSWIATNLTVGSGGRIGGIPNVTFTLSWLAPCDNPSIAPASSNCNFEEYWSGNLSSNEVGGPFTSERIASSAHNPGEAAPPNPPSWLLVLLGIVAAALLGALLVARLGRPPRRPKSDPNAELEGSQGQSSPSTTSPTQGTPDPLDDFF